MSTRQPATKSDGGRLVRSFGFAFRGLGILLRTQANARIHLVVTLLVLVGGFCCGISRLEWCAVVAAVGLVWTAEGLNTAIEAVVDLVSPEDHPLAGKAKDVGAASVFCAALMAVVIGFLVFGPRVVALFGR